MSAPEAFVLLTIPNTTLTAFDATDSGTLNLACVTVQVSDAEVDRDVYLMLRLNDTETPIDPAGTIDRTDSPGCRTYTFHSTETYPADRVLRVSTAESNHFIAEDLETFETLLAQYADFRGTPNPFADAQRSSSVPPHNSPVNAPDPYGDLRGHLVAINEDTGEVIGQFDDSQFSIREDPRLHEKGHENDAVYIEMPDVRSGAEQDATALQMFIRAIPPDQQDWITKSATVVSHAISKTTSLLLTTITAASSYYISHSSPSPHHPSMANASSSKSTPSPPPPRALVFLTSEKTRKGLAGVHAVSGQAVKVSAKTVSTIDGMIRRAMGSKPKHARRFIPSRAPTTLSPGSSSPHLPPRAPSPAGSSKLNPDAPPPYPNTSTSYLANTPPLPQRRSPSPAGPPLPPRTSDGLPGDALRGAQPRLRKRDRVLLSLDLILSTFDHETRRLLDGSTQTVGAVVGHKYGPDAAHTSLLVAGTARNVGLVYVDMRGIGRRALLRRAGTQFVKGRLSSH